MKIMDFIQNVLKIAKCPLTAREIYYKGIELGYAINGKTPWKSISVTLLNDIKKIDKKSIFISLGNRPKTYWLKSCQLSANEEIKRDIEKKEKEFKFKKIDLHPLVVSFLRNNKEFELYCKTIRHERNKQDDKVIDTWKYPDIVGVHFPFYDYDKTSFMFLNNLNLTNYKVYSFKINISLNQDKFKEYYFQAVNNSTFANYGYLVAFKIDDNILDELKLLNQSYGIGIIKLDSNPKNSKVILPARENKLDIDAIKVLAKNADFKKFMIDINKCIMTYLHLGNDTLKFDALKDLKFDKVLNEEEIKKYNNMHNIK